MDAWKILHDYRRLSLKGKVEPLSCDICDYNVVTRFGPGDDPVLYCVVCDITVTPGIGLLTSLKTLIDIERGAW